MQQLQLQLHLSKADAGQLPAEQLWQQYVDQQLTRST